MFTPAAFALFLSVAGVNWLDVPFIRQPKNDCGPASIWMIMQYWHAATPPIDEIHRATFSKEAEGVYARDMQTYLDANGFQTWTFAGNWETLQEHLRNGRPIVVALRGTPLHYVVVAGVDENQQILFLNDPASRKLQAIHRRDFEKRWQATNNWALLALPAENAKPAMSAPPTSTPSLPASESQSYPVPLLERASAAFRRQDYGEAKTYSKRVAKAAPLDGINNELLATLYLLDDNVEAALKYWNRLGQPIVRNIEIDPPTPVDPVLLDHAFAFSRGTLISVNDYLSTRRRLEATRLFFDYSFDLVPADDNRFDVRLRAANSSGAHYLGWLTGVPYQTVRPQFTNLGGRTLNLDSMLRWDSNKRRATIALDGPFPASDTLRLSASVIARDERWDLRGANFRVRRVDGTVMMHGPISGKGTFTTGMTAGNARLGYRGTLDYDLLRWPEQRLVVSGGVRVEVARNQSDRFAKTEPSLRMHWLPKARGTDFETSVQVRAGRSTLRTPEDELFILGLDRDSDLQLRAHSQLSDGRKGGGLIGNRYFLMNLETRKVLHDFGIARFSAGPFIDTGRMSSVFIDTGLFLNLAVGRSMSVTFSVGRDIFSGHTVGSLN